MDYRIRKLIHAVLILLAVIMACDSDSGGQDNPGFQLINSYYDHTRLSLLYNENVSGDVTWIESVNDLGISDADEFNSSTATKTTKTVVSDGQEYDNYITSASYGSNTTVHMYVLYRSWVWALSGTTSSDGSTVIEGSVTGAHTIDTTITLPAGYSDDTITRWPLIVSIKGGYFANLPCISYHTDIGGGTYEDYNLDREAIRAQVNSIIEGTTNVGGAPARIDRSRIYGFGFSAGGCAVMQIANDDASSLYGFRAIVGIGISDWIGEYYSENLGDTDIWLFWGENDDPYGPETVAAYNYLPNGSGQHLLTEMYGQGHTSYPVVVSPYTYRWLLSR